MSDTTASTLSKAGKVAAFLLVWGVTAWLLYPLIFLNSVSLQQATNYFYRSAMGIIIMIILFGKTLFDLFFPLDTSRKQTILQVIFLTAYALLMAGGIILMCMRILLVYLKADSEGTLY
jgi:hypothetical protein